MQKGKKIGPDDIVGYVGRSGRKETSYGSHLHITKYDLSSLSDSTKQIYFSINNKKNIDSEEDLKLYEIESISSELVNYRVNPISKRNKRNENKKI